MRPLNRPRPRLSRLLLILAAILLLSAIGTSCRSSRQTALERTASVAAEVERSSRQAAVDEILTFIDAACWTDLSGITVEFYRPDSVTPDARAAPAPKTLRIESARSGATVGQTVLQQSAAAALETESVDTQANLASAEQSEVDRSVFRPPAWLTALSVIALLILLSLAVARRLRR